MKWFCFKAQNSISIQNKAIFWSLEKCIFPAFIKVEYCGSNFLRSGASSFKNIGPPTNVWKDEKEFYRNFSKILMLIDFLIDCHLPKRKSYIFVIVQYISFSVKDYFPTKIVFWSEFWHVCTLLLKTCWKKSHFSLLNKISNWHLKLSNSLPFKWFH